MKIRSDVLLCLAAFAALASTTACDDILEQDISDETIEIISPADSLILNENPIVFQWEAIIGSSGYVLQVADPDFVATEKLVVDTLVEASRFIMPLEYGKYQWRVRGINSAYFTPYTIHTFWLDSARIKE